MQRIVPMGSQEASMKGALRRVSDRGSRSMFPHMGNERPCILVQEGEGKAKAQERAKGVRCLLSETKAGEIKG